MHWMQQGTKQYKKYLKQYLVFTWVMENKILYISKIYFDRPGYGSTANTLKDAREKNKSIKMEDVEQFF